MGGADVLIALAPGFLCPSEGTCAINFRRLGPTFQSHPSLQASSSAAKAGSPLSLRPAWISC